jgi:polar amino acid transport system substrate-binding protein
MGRLLRAFSLVAALLFLLTWSGQSQTSGAFEQIRKWGVLLWGSDAEGGAPYVFPDPNDPSRRIGFEVDLAMAIATTSTVHPADLHFGLSFMHTDP